MKTTAPQSTSERLTKRPRTCNRDGITFIQYSQREQDEKRARRRANTERLDKATFEAPIIDLMLDLGETHEIEGAQNHRSFEEYQRKQAKIKLEQEADQLIHQRAMQYQDQWQLQSNENSGSLPHYPPCSPHRPSQRLYSSDPTPYPSSAAANRTRLPSPTAMLVAKLPMILPAHSHAHSQPSSPFKSRLNIPLPPPKPVLLFTLSHSPPMSPQHQPASPKQSWSPQNPRYLQFETSNQSKPTQALLAEPVDVDFFSGYRSSMFTPSSPKAHSVEQNQLLSSKGGRERLLFPSPLDMMNGRLLSSDCN